MKLLTPLLLIVVSIAVFYWYINPTYQNIGTLRAEANQYQQALAQTQDAMTKRDALLAKYNSINTADTDRLNKALPNHHNAVQLVLDLNSIAAQYGTNIRNMNFGTGPLFTDGPNASSGGSAAAVPLTFTVSLTYPNFLSFLATLEQDLRITDISTISFAPSDSGIYDYTITIKTYWLK